MSLFKPKCGDDYQWIIALFAGVIVAVLTAGGFLLWFGVHMIRRWIAG